MVDPLNAWWAQQLVLCDWAFEPDPTAVDEQLAVARLIELGVIERGELGWRLIEAFPPGPIEPLRQLASLELLALASSAGWMPWTQARAWVQRLAGDITKRYGQLDEWLQALLQARGQEGWVRGDDGFFEACEALAVLEHEGEGITWEVLTEYLSHQRAPGALWPEGGDLWRLRAAFAPVLTLPPDENQDWSTMGGWLADVWQVHDREELVRVMLWLAAQGDRYGWDLEAARLLDQDAEARREWLTSLESAEPYGQVMLAFLKRGEPLEWGAWDWLRLVDLAYVGWGLGWLSDDEAVGFAAHAADLLTRRYSDWVAMVHAYQRGRSLFEGRDGMAHIERDWELLLQSPVSPWKKPLHDILDEGTRQAGQALIRAWRLDARHWLLSLASIREPDLLQRQGPPMDSTAARRRDVQGYLRETLGLYPDDGLAGLSRYWLPAQAHHLNQLAADAGHNALPLLATPFGKPSERAVLQRDGLKACSRHAATIHMAEKYAFYLQMALDSGDFDAQGIMDLAESLRGVLCRFYSGPRRLLDAWAAWEQALPEDGQASLVHEIRWHREDPGSPFHWLDWHSGAWQEPGPRPTLTRFTALSLVGPLNAGAWSEPLRESERESEDIREWIDGHYGLHDAEGLREFLAFLLDAGDRQDYQINYAPYTLNVARLESEIATLESDDCDEDERNHLLRLKRVRDNDAGCNEMDMTAWDVAQAVDLAIAGRQLGWLNEARFATTLDAALALAETHYSGWSEYARGLYAGFAFFMGETEEREAFLTSFREALVAWLTGAPPLAGAWASLDFPGARPRHWAPLHIDTLPGDVRTLH
ncbi:hypothetical protein L861_09405 [Litchfieldella anticariensis FP35 = DSM 16096]|uniref:DUF1266 domain-containing protein n=1 Tax=Litchfieldella anticariensis (strain DSM 16096 / CECT 5854 / CIP 108499 / LMG 22089 / FP35) TaxID=1121939 RepID=S2KKT6_LITA3|nr:DUF1266 domain-containing protein [Halomonas anticariensis]EPC02550.1 hypothetical protein L861_09405 [Halomonas anticariensis FP35 = DSM 16096]